MASLVNIEPYLRVGAKWMAGNEQSSGKPTWKNYADMTVAEKARMCCTDYNSVRGCSRPAGQCKARHWCAFVEGNRVCWKRDHGLRQHK